MVYRTLQPWKEQVSEIEVQINKKLTKFKATQMTVASLLDEHPTVKLVTTTKESVEQMTQELAAPTASYTKINTKIWNTVKPPKDDEGGSGMSNK